MTGTGGRCVRWLRWFSGYLLSPSGRNLLFLAAQFSFAFPVLVVVRKHPLLVEFILLCWQEAPSPFPKCECGGVGGSAWGKPGRGGALSHRPGSGQTLGWHTRAPAISALEKVTQFSYNGRKWMPRKSLEKNQTENNLELRCSKVCHGQEFK